jgi:predicted AAA+ superfamily ATPase
MKRDIYQKLLAWKTSPRRKPLLLEGARQTGKTYILEAFGHDEYDRTLYCNFETESYLDHFFERDLKPERILSDLSIHFNHQIRPGQDLLIFDEIQASNRALNSLKYFAEQRSDVHLAAAGSLLGLKMSRPGSFPVGKVNFLKLWPMTFLEYLSAAGDSRYRQIIESIAHEPAKLPEAFHLHLVDRLREYYFSGGMPEAVKQFTETGNAGETREIQGDIIKSYTLDFAKHAAVDDIPKLSLIWDSIPKHLARENKKFIFSAVKKGARARSFEGALTWLKDAGLTLLANAVQQAKLPLKHYADHGCFKVYALDVGLLGAMAGTPIELLAGGGRLFNDYEGAFVENYVAQQLAARLNSHRLYYWRSRGGRAELDFLCETGEAIIPLEVKAGINPRSKSLRSYDQQFNPHLLARTTLLNLKRDGKILNLPLYAISQLPALLS